MRPIVHYTHQPANLGVFFFTTIPYQAFMFFVQVRFALSVVLASIRSFPTSCTPFYCT